MEFRFFLYSAHDYLRLLLRTHSGSDEKTDARDGGHNAQGSACNASQAQSQRVKWNIIKTMIIVTAFFSCCWLPWNVILLLVKVAKLGETVRYIAMALPYVNIALNPFIYATKYEGVRLVLARMIKCRRRDGVGGVGT